MCLAHNWHYVSLNSSFKRGVSGCHGPIKVNFTGMENILLPLGKSPMKLTYKLLIIGQRNPRERFMVPFTAKLNPLPVKLQNGCLPSAYFHVEIISKPCNSGFTKTYRNFEFFFSVMILNYGLPIFQHDSPIRFTISSTSKPKPSIPSPVSPSIPLSPIPSPLSSSISVSSPSIPPSTPSTPSSYSPIPISPDQYSPDEVPMSPVSVSSPEYLVSPMSPVSSPESPVSAVSSTESSPVMPTYTTIFDEPLYNYIITSPFNNSHLSSLTNCPSNIPVPVASSDSIAPLSQEDADLLNRYLGIYDA